MRVRIFNVYAPSSIIDEGIEINKNDDIVVKGLRYSLVERIHEDETLSPEQVRKLLIDAGYDACIFVTEHK